MIARTAINIGNAGVTYISNAGVTYKRKNEKS